MFEVRFFVDRPNALWEALKRLDMPGVYNLTQRPVRQEHGPATATNGHAPPSDSKPHKPKAGRENLRAAMTRELKALKQPIVTREQLGEMLVKVGRSRSAVDYFVGRSGLKLVKPTGRPSTYRVNI